MASRLRVTHWSTRLGAALGALALLTTLGRAAVAAVILRCCSDNHGPTWSAWVVMALLLLLLAIVGALIGAAIFVAVRKIFRISS